jgi:hypothetical protein
MHVLLLCVYWWQAHVCVLVADTCVLQYNIARAIDCTCCTVRALHRVLCVAVNGMLQQACL